MIWDKNIMHILHQYASFNLLVHTTVICSKMCWWYKQFRLQVTQRTNLSAWTMCSRRGRIISGFKGLNLNSVHRDFIAGINLETQLQIKQKRTFSTNFSITESQRGRGRVDVDEVIWKVCFKINCWFVL